MRQILIITIILFYICIINFILFGCSSHKTNQSEGPSTMPTDSFLVHSVDSPISTNSSSNQKNNVEYDLVTIGSQIWMCKNLNVDKFKNGDPILHAISEDEWRNASENNVPAWCYLDNELKNGKKYGKLYNWWAVIDPRGLAPEGYHIPSKNEYEILIQYLGGAGYYAAQAKMKSVKGWLDTDGADNSNATNESGFTGLPGGFRNEQATFLHEMTDGYWWTTTDNSTNTAIYLSLFVNPEIYMFGYIYKVNGLSVRCVKD